MGPEVVRAYFHRSAEGDALGEQSMQRRGLQTWRRKTILNTAGLIPGAVDNISGTFGQ